jgi:large subunit ribosomal protein L18|tara:strand:+ start:1196 stop:1684 length:489 start_codon:yes stop_codon:yes gene_type:complete
MAYTRILKRIRSEKTNYKKRKIMLMSKRDFISINVTNENTQVQILKPDISGDKVLASAHSRFLLKDGWKGSRKNIPAAYLTGYYAGKKALSKGVSNAIVYSGTRKYTQRMAAVVKGVVDAGLQVPSNEETFPPKERINGDHLKVKNDITTIKSKIDDEVKIQ